MNRSFAAELVWRMSPTLRREFVHQPELPPSIAMQLERLRLLELIRTAQDKPKAQRVPVDAAA
jgi:hypothetical protein